ncbi:MAG TPA: hypothetical protein VNO22_05530 [Planctomycetota bacterium]|nr:hypothetical protein [Planctomycetota bacterium]
MKRAAVLAAGCLFWAACAGPGDEGKGTPSEGPPAPLPAALAAEPPWADLVRHAAPPPPARVLHPAPSPDGRLVAYATTEFGPRLQIAVRDASGTAPARITRADADHLFPRISPDGRLVAYAANPDGNYDIFIARLDAPGAVRQITFEPGDDVAPAWSPDGKSLVYSARGTSGKWGLVVADVAGRTRTYLGPGLYPDWSPDSKDPWICFQSAPSGPEGWSGLWRIRPDGTQLREVMAGGPDLGSAVHPRFSPDGRWIAYARTGRSFDAAAVLAPEDADDLWAVRSDGAFETRLTEGGPKNSWPAWAAGRLFFVSDRAGGRGLWSFRVKPLEEEP